MAAASPPAAAAPVAPALVPEVPIATRAWERLFGAGSVTHCLSNSEARRCRGVCRDWRRLAGAGACEEELWNSDLGPTHRGAAWKHLLLGGITLRQKAGTHQDYYEKLCEKESEYDSVIRRDVNRTLPQEERFREKNGEGQLALFRLLRALAIRLCDIGYCQSLNFIVATLIGIFPEDEALAFQCALALLLRYSLVDLYRPKFAKLGVVVWQFDRIVEGFLPKVHTALVRHGVNSEYYAIQWFLTLFASDLSQPIVRRIWDRFLVAGWRIVVQVGLALLYTIQDTLPGMDTCNALMHLRKFAKSCPYDAEQLLNAAASFKVSHRMLSALEAAYNWEDDVQLLVIKDLNSGQVHWAVQALKPEPPSSAPRRDCGDEDEEEPPIEMPRAFSRRDSQGGGGQEPDLGGPLDGTDEARGTVLPFLIRNLDTGDETVLNEAWSQYTDDISRRAKASAGPLQATPSASPERMPAVSGEDSSSEAGRSGRTGISQSPPSASGQPQQAGGGSYWMQSVQRQAVRRLGQV